MADYWESDELKELAEDLISKHHTHLAEAKIAYIFRDKAPRKYLSWDGEVTQVIPVTAGRIGGGRNSVLINKDFVIEYGYDVWQDHSVAERSYWLDMALSSCMGDEDAKTGAMQYFIVPYPITVFPDVIARHGMIEDGVRELYAVLKKADEEERKVIYKTKDDASDPNSKTRENEQDAVNEFPIAE